MRIDADQRRINSAGDALLKQKDRLAEPRGSRSKRSDLAACVNINFDTF